MEMWLLMFKCRLRTFCSPFYKVGKACPDSCRIGIIATSESPQKQSINNIQLPIRSSVFNLSYVHVMQLQDPHKFASKLLGFPLLCELKRSAIYESQNLTPINGRSCWPMR